MVRQAEIIFNDEPGAPIASIEEVEWLQAVLKGRGWMTAAELVAASHGTRNDRKIRAIARAAAPGIFSYPGSPGYKLWNECTMEELNHGDAAMGSQIRDMTIRRSLYERAYRSRYGGLS